MSRTQHVGRAALKRALKPHGAKAPKAQGVNRVNAGAQSAQRVTSAAKTPFAVLRNQWQQTLKSNTKPTLRDLINAESALGRTLFGPIPMGHQREFFTAQRNVWIWHERWLNNAGLPEEMTIRYEVHPHGVYKRATGQGSYQKIEGDELENFRHATKAYLEIIKRQLYN